MWLWIGSLLAIVGSSIYATQKSGNGGQIEATDEESMPCKLNKLSTMEKFLKRLQRALPYLCVVIMTTAYAITMVLNLYGHEMGSLDIEESNRDLHVVRRTQRFETLLTFLKSLEGRDVQYCPNPGNAGDALIHVGFSRLAELANLTYTRISTSIDKAQIGPDVVLYGGGGNLVDYYSDAAKFIRLAAPRCKLLAILPHTVNGNEELLRTLPANVHIWAREQVSYEYLKSIVPLPNEQVHLSHDMAFALEDTGWLRSWWRGEADGASKQLDKDKPNKRAHQWCSNIHGPRNRTMYAFRQDKEVNEGRKSYLLPTCSEDISNTCSGVSAEDIARRFLGAIALAQEGVIHTDRLHVSIGSALLGCSRVVIYPGAYYKILAVYQHSISGYGYENSIALVEDDAISGSLKAIVKATTNDSSCQVLAQEQKCNGCIIDTL
jgi:exopolysaccharide biosynthesis predicted pyruvyltransferase EpsI